MGGEERVQGPAGAVLRHAAGWVEAAEAWAGRQAEKEWNAIEMAGCRGPAPL